MPTYGYECEKCENEFEVFQKMNEKPITKCPSCSGKTSRILYPVGIVFKGSGFYKTDNRTTGETSKPAEQPKSPSKKKSEDKTAKESKKTA